jgi:uncharacterized RDD family membrane protein YckC
MANEEREVEHTDLIDVGDISPDFGEPITEPGAEVTEGGGLPQFAPPAEAAGPTIAGLRDRFAAFLIDVAFLYVVYWVTMVLFRAVALDSAMGPIPAWGVGGLIFHGIFLLLAFLWFVLPEFIFQGSVGKLLCNLSVHGGDGAPPAFTAVLLRNLLRVLDILLAPLLITFATLEWTTWHQRLGDLAAHTVVIKKLARPTRQYALTLDMIASASRRTIAFIIDLTLFGAFVVGYGLMLSPEQPLNSMFLVVLFPFAFLTLITALERITRTSPGKWILGLTVCHEDGTPIDLPGALIRTLWRPVDNNPIGFLVCLLSLRKQRPGDVAAGSLVVRAPREWRGFLGLIATFLIVAATLYAGLNNRDNFLRAGFEINFLPSVDFRGISRPRRALPLNLTIRNFRFAAGDPETVRSPSIFHPGERLFLVFDVAGYSLKDGQAWIQEDLSVRYPDESVGLKLEKINDFRGGIEEAGPIRFENNVALPPEAKSGRYTVAITIRDVHSRRELKELRFFYISPPKGRGEEPGER